MVESSPANVKKGTEKKPVGPKKGLPGPNDF